MKYVQTSSRWGSSYVLRFWLNGRRIRDDEAQAALSAIKAGEHTRKDEVTSYGYRLTLESA